MPVCRCALTILEGYPSHLVSTASSLALVDRKNTADDCKGVGNNRVEVTFTGALTYNSSGVLVNEDVPGQRRWVGEPTPNVDAAWDDLKECR